MKIVFIFLLSIMLWQHAFAQETSQKVYISTKESLENRKTPQWFNDAKLGIFIHLGLYSVPAWATPSTTPDKVKDWKAFYKNNPYAEWYLNSLRINGSPTQVHHQKVYGKDYDYYSFKDSLINKTTNWKAESWAGLFAKIGARYVVFTSKHHDGFCMYPTKVMNPFMEKEKITSSRDFVGELGKAVRERGLKYGVYYSGGIDWTFSQSPITNLWPDLFESMPKSVAYTGYVDCQMHEIIQRYKPDVLWNDVNYPINGDVTGIFAELFNLNSNAVVNDRWRQFDELSNFTTPEYTFFDKVVPKKWETCRGIGYSFGYNQVESDVELLSSEALIHLLVNIVCNNGNLLLNVGPKADGSIPENQLKRLNDLGEWMKINGMGIHDTHPYSITSTRLKDGTEVRYTQKNNDLYVFLLSIPSGKSIVLPSIRTSKTTKFLLYGDKIKPLTFSMVSDGIEIKLPTVLDFKFAKMIKITDLTNLN